MREIETQYYGVHGLNNEGRKMNLWTCEQVHLCDCG